MNNVAKFHFRQSNPILQDTFCAFLTIIFSSSGRFDHVSSGHQGPEGAGVENLMHKPVFLILTALVPDSGVCERGPCAVPLRSLPGESD